MKRWKTTGDSGPQTVKHGDAKAMNEALTACLRKRGVSDNLGGASRLQLLKQIRDLRDDNEMLRGEIAKLQAAKREWEAAR
jgi:hypothetical protein